MEMKKIIMTVHCHPSTSQLGTLLEQQDRFSKVKFWPGLQANTDKLRDYEVCKLVHVIIHLSFSKIIQVFRRLQISENYLEVLKRFPANFRFILLQHSLDRYVCTNVSLHSLNFIVITLMQVSIALCLPHSTSATTFSHKERAASATNW